MRFTSHLINLIHRSPNLNFFKSLKSIKRRGTYVQIFPGFRIPCWSFLTLPFFLRLPYSLLGIIFTLLLILLDFDPYYFPRYISHCLLHLYPILQPIAGFFSMAFLMYTSTNSSKLPFNISSSPKLTIKLSLSSHSSFSNTYL